MKSRLYIILFALIIFIGCKGKVTDTKGPAKQTPTNIPELPYILQGDYTPDTGVMYKVIIGGDTCFVTVDSISKDSIHGYYYQVVAGSNCVERKKFVHDRHWKDKRHDALVYVYKEPEYKAKDDALFQRPTKKIKVQRDIEYGQALGYWCSKPGTQDDSYLQIALDCLTTAITKTTQSLKMDVYMPDDTIDNDKKHPLLLLLHGGGFLVGDKGDSAISGWCKHFASMGYVAVSANYRLGFFPTKNEITRTGYMALQDAHAAMRFMVDHAKYYNIDTSNIFVGGASAGSITALNLAFMTDNDRPQAVKGNRFRDMGTIASSGNSSHATFRIKALANMWGAITNLNMLKNSKTDIISFHGDQDMVVPYDKGYPFKDVSEKLGKRLFDLMYGSVQIDLRAKDLGLRSEFHSFKDQGHSLHRYSDGSWNQKNFEFIRDKMSAFFYEEIAGKKPNLEEDASDPRHIYIDAEGISDIAWHIDGGFIMKIDDNDIWVVWRDESNNRTVRASGINEKGFAFNIKKIIEK